MGLEFLNRVRRSSIVVGLVAALVLATYAGIRAGSAVALGAAWSLVNLFLIERLTVAITGLDRSSFTMFRRASFAVLGMLALFAIGAGLLSVLPPELLLAGFWIPFAVLVLKAASRLVLESGFWRRLVASRWRAAAAVTVVLVAAWWAVPAVLQGNPQTDPARDSTTTGSEHASEGAAHEDEGPQKFANVVTILSRAFPNAGWAHFLHEYEAIVFSLLVALLICIVAFFASRNPAMIPGPLQNGAEMLVEQLNDFVVGILGAKHGPRFVPFLGTLFLYIWVMNLFGLIPFMDSPTSNLNVTFGLAIMVFLYSQWTGLRMLGIKGWVHHLMGSPRDIAGWALAPLMFPIHVLGELAKPISLSCRLFGNIFGEDMLLVAFVSLGVTSLAFANLPFGLPLQLPFIGLALLTSTLQALIFTVLSTIYFLLMLPHDEHHEGEEHPAH